MKLISEIINKRLELYNEMELSHQYIKSVWHFYSLYSLCLCITGFDDSNISRKNIMISKLINKFDFKLYSKILHYMKNDMNVINTSLQMLEELKEDEDFYGDYDLPDMIAISQYD